MKRVILASQSLSRKELFESLGIPFEVIPANIDEKSIRDQDLSIKAENIAREKAEKIHLAEEGIIISADTFSFCKGQVFEKPNDLDEAYEMLKFLSGREAKNYTGFCYIDPFSSQNFSTTVVTSYKFRKLYDEEIKKYVKIFPVTQWAAAFALTFPYPLSFISEISGSLTGFSCGLPMELLIPSLKKSGFEPNPIKA